jgi:hypothetical protein
VSEYEFRITDASDVKPAARTILLNNWNRDEIDHCFTDIRGQIPNSNPVTFDRYELVDAPVCVIHGGAACQLSQEDLASDFVFIGMPCQPVSQNRSGRFATGAVANHPEAVVYDLVAELLESRNVKAGAIEEVMGFDLHGTDEGETPMRLFVAKLKQSKKYAVRVIKLDSAKFARVQRARCAALV